MSLSGRRALVTGATGGIGEALCRALTDDGVSVLLSGRDQKKLEDIASSLPAPLVLGKVAVDLLQEEQIEHLAAAAAEAGVDTLINVSGANDLCAFDTQDPGLLRRMVDLNLTSPMRLVQLLLPHLKTTTAGMIVNIGSAFGSIGYPGYVSYCATKFGLRGFSEALRRELADTGLRVIYVAPRATETPMNSSNVTAMNEALGNKTDTPQQVAKEVLRAMAKGQRSKVLGWPEKFFARLNQVLPGVVDKALLKQLPTVRRHI